MATLAFTTSGVMTITLQGARFGQLTNDPGEGRNVKRFGVGPTNLELEVHSMNEFTPWGEIEIVEDASSGGAMTVSIDTNAIGWFGSAQFRLHSDNGQHVISDNFQSGVGGGPSRRSKPYNINSFR